MNKNKQPSEKIAKHIYPGKRPETEPDAVPEVTPTPEEEPDVIPEEELFETPPEEKPVPGEGP